MFDIITDSACDWTPEKAKQYNVEVVPRSIRQKQ